MSTMTEITGGVEGVVKKDKQMDPVIAAGNALKYVLEAVAGEKVLIICDDIKKDIGRCFAHGALEIGLQTRLAVLSTDTPTPRKEIPLHVLEMVKSMEPDIVITILKGGAEEVAFRVKLIQYVTRVRRRLGHCPGITMDMLTIGALALEEADYKKLHEETRALLANLQDVISARLQTPAGTDVTMNLKGRDFFTDTFLDWKTLKWMNLPVGEVIAGPVENSLQGRFVCDLAMGGRGRIAHPIVFQCEKGRAVSYESEDKEALEEVRKTLSYDSLSNAVGEFAIGLNPAARVMPEFLETEKVRGTSHIAFGHNLDYPGGQNSSATHLDFLVSQPTITVTYSDGSSKVIVKDGKLVS
ncbi:MAG: aminopeptidase [Thermoplasmata archaeon]